MGYFCDCADAPAEFLKGSRNRAWFELGFHGGTSCDCADAPAELIKGSMRSLIANKAVDGFVRTQQSLFHCIPTGGAGGSRGKAPAGFSEHCSVSGLVRLS